VFQCSDGVLAAPFLEGSAVYDLLTDQVMFVSALAAWVLRRVPADLDQLVAEVAESTSEPPELVAEDIHRGVRLLCAAGLLNRPGVWVGPTPVSGRPLAETPGTGQRYLSTTQAVIDHRLAFRSADRGLLAEIERSLKTTAVPHSPTVVFDAEPTAGGGVLLNAAEEWDFPTRAGFFLQLSGVVNDFAARSSQPLIFHAGAVRTPGREVILLPGNPEAGKSTITAALLRAGCDYLGDELIGVREGSHRAVGFPRALQLDATSRSVVGLGSSGFDTDGEVPVHPRSIRPDVESLFGDVGPVAAIVMPEYAPDARLAETRMEPPVGLRRLLPSVTNLHRCGPSGWQTFCELVETVPVWGLTHSNANEAALRVLAGVGQRASRTV